MTVRFISYDSVDFDFVKKIRNDVFEKEQGAIAEQEFDLFDSDPKTLFALVEENGVPVATGRIAFMPKGVKSAELPLCVPQGGQGAARFSSNRSAKCAKSKIYILFMLILSFMRSVFMKNSAFVPPASLRLLTAVLSIFL